MLAFITAPIAGGDLICSGTVVSSNLVLTAAHCAEDIPTGIAYPASGYRVVTGSLDWTNAAARQVSAVSAVLIDPGFNPSTLDGGDVALLELSTTTTAPPVALATTSALLAPGTADMIAGWGRTNASDPASIPAQLQYGYTVTQDDTYCAQQATASEALFDPADQICAVDSPTYQDAACNGDSGGPLLADFQSSTPIEVGITSFGSADCSPKLGDFFTRADAIAVWVDTQIAALKPPTPTPKPTPSPAPNPPSTAHPGRYHGSTSQHKQIAMTVGSTGEALTTVRFGFRLSCQHRQHLNRTLTTHGLQLHGLQLKASFRGHSGEHYTLTGSFTSSGSAQGNFSSTASSGGRYGACRTGVVRWQTKL
jgi:secreted trypsin-like serine protease